MTVEIAPGPAISGIPSGHDRRVARQDRPPRARGGRRPRSVRQAHDREEDAAGDLKGGQRDAEEPRRSRLRSGRRSRGSAPPPCSPAAAMRRRSPGMPAVSETKIGAASIGLMTEKREENARTTNFASADENMGEVYVKRRGSAERLGGAGSVAADEPEPGGGEHQGQQGHQLRREHRDARDRRWSRRGVVVVRVAGSASWKWRSPCSRGCRTGRSLDDDRDVAVPPTREGSEVRRHGAVGSDRRRRRRGPGWTCRRRRSCPAGSGSVTRRERRIAGPALKTVTVYVSGCPGVAGLLRRGLRTTGRRPLPGGGVGVGVSRRAAWPSASRSCVAGVCVRVAVRRLRRRAVGVVAVAVPSE